MDALLISDLLSILGSLATIRCAQRVDYFLAVRNPPLQNFDQRGLRFDQSIAQYRQFFPASGLAFNQAPIHLLVPPAELMMEIADGSGQRGKRRNQIGLGDFFHRSWRTFGQQVPDSDQQNNGNDDVAQHFDLLDGSHES